MLAVAVMAALSLAHPAYFARRRWTVPVANFGQLVVSTSVGLGLLAVLLPPGPLDRGDIPRVLAAAIPAALVYDWVNFQLVAFMTRRLYPGRPAQAWSSLLSSHLAMTVLGMLGSLAGVAYLLGGPVVLPLVGLTFVAGHLGFHSYARRRRAHLDTVHGFVKAIEALDPYTRGHTDRVAHFVTITGSELGLGPERMERLHSAALLHDVGKLAVPAALLRRSGPPTPEEEAAVVRHMRVVESLLAEIEVLAPVVAPARGGPSGRRRRHRQPRGPGAGGRRCLRRDDLHPLLPGRDHPGAGLRPAAGRRRGRRGQKWWRP